jgi:hypothetical protein
MFAEVRHTYGRAHQRLRQKFTGILDQIRCRDQVLESYWYRGGRHARSSCPI